jgi:hypothetical protein
MSEMDEKYWQQRPLFNFAVFSYAAGLFAEAAAPDRSAWGWAGIIFLMSAPFAYTFSKKLNDGPFVRMLYTSAPIASTASGWLAADTFGPILRREPAGALKVFAAVAATVCSCLPAIHLDKRYYTYEQSQKKCQRPNGVNTNSEPSGPEA